MKKFYNFIFKSFALFSIIVSFIFLIIIFASIIQKGYKAFYTHHILLSITLTPDSNKDGPNLNKKIITFNATINNALNKISSTYNINNVDNSILSINSSRILENFLKSNPSALNKKITIPLLLSSNADMLLKNDKRALNNLTQNEITFIETAKKNNLILQKINWLFFSNQDSRYPEIAGIKGALMGSLVTIVLTVIFSFIIGVATAIYLQEFLIKGPSKSIIEVNISNLAAVPSIIFGLLGLSLFQNLLNISRSSPLLASMVLTLMILPNIIVYSQLALSTVPNSIKEAAFGIGASKNQVIFSHVLPLALPGIITGLIIGISRALGETAPLLIIGMLAFASNTNFTVLGAATTLPTQILMWFNMPEVGFVEKTSAAIMILLLITILINLIASYIRKKFTKKL